MSIDIARSSNFADLFSLSQYENRSADRLPQTIEQNITSRTWGQWYSTFRAPTLDFSSYIADLTILYGRAISNEALGLGHTSILSNIVGKIALLNVSKFFSLMLIGGGGIMAIKELIAGRFVTSGICCGIAYIGYLRYETEELAIAVETLRQNNVDFRSNITSLENCIQQLGDLFKNFAERSQSFAISDERVPGLADQMRVFFESAQGRELLEIQTAVNEENRKLERLATELLRTTEALHQVQANLQNTSQRIEQERRSLAEDRDKFKILNVFIPEIIAIANKNENISRLSQNGRCSLKDIERLWEEKLRQMFEQV